MSAAESTTATTPPPRLDRTHLPDDVPVVLACSGGSDSMALLHLVAGEAPGTGWSVTVAHLDHALRDDSAADTVFVQEAAARLGLRCVSARLEVARHIGPGEGLEAAARRLRYEFLEQERRRIGPDALVLTGHTADDQVETVAMRIGRGAALRGMRGILPRRDDGVVRPLLRARRAALRAWLESKGITWREDETNADISIPRNALRQRIDRMPERRVAHLHRAALGLAAMAGALHGPLETLAAWWLDAHIAEGAARTPAAPAPERLWPGEFLLVPPEGRFHLDALDNALLDVALERLGADPREVAQRLRELLIDAMHDRGGDRTSGGGGTLLQVGPALWAERVPAGLLLARGVDADWQASAGPSLEPALPTGPATAHTSLPRGGMLAIRLADREELERLAGGAPAAGIGSSRLVLGRDLADNGVRVRYPRSGDVMRPFGMTGRKMLSDLFGEAGVPRLRRGRLPLLDSGRGILWVAGLRAAEATRLRAGSGEGYLLELETEDL